MYFFGTNKPLGDLRYIQIWHDNSGSHGFKSWFISKITVDDLEKHERYTFHCNKWLGIDDEDCLLDRIIPASTLDTISFNDGISVEAQRLMSVYHLWISLLFPPQGKFTRVQRLSCLMALLCLIMISNAMFFRSSDEDQNVDEVKFGVLTLSFGTFYVSCVGMLISTVPVTVAAFVFRNITNSKSVENRINNPRKLNFSPLRKDNYKAFSRLDGEVFSPNQGTLPCWVFYIAWSSVVLGILLSVFFLILYSMEWGKASSEEWLSSLALSFLESFIVFDPIKVIIFAVIYSTFLKLLEKEDPPSVNLDKLRSISKDNKLCQESSIS
ncbi:polycystin-1-like protein 2, partial [Saccostrea cucullata]|uniref:polycystin-1-like protein 2 n=1 Tax=Saccostrea cuccullata TaxID=36930 RepID=UPI002ED30CD2